MLDNRPVTGETVKSVHQLSGEKYTTLIFRARYLDRFTDLWRHRSLSDTSGVVVLRGSLSLKLLVDVLPAILQLLLHRVQLDPVQLRQHQSARLGGSN